MRTQPRQQAAEVHASMEAPDNLLVSLSGDWLLSAPRPPASPVIEQIRTSRGIQRIAFDTHRLGNWDTGLVKFLAKIEATARDTQIPLDRASLPEGAARLLELTFAVGERKGARRESKQDTFLTRLGAAVMRAMASTRDMVSFIGQVLLSLGRWFRGRAAYQRSDLWVCIQEAGAAAVGIVSLIGFLVGVIMAFVGAGELQKFGAGLYTANLVGIGMLRELSPIMAGIIMSGRTGASYAAELGSMKVNEEIDAMRTMGIDPMDFLVLPRVVALIIMMPLLTAYADLMGLLGGALVTVSVLDVSSVQYWGQIVTAVSLSDGLGGLFKAAIYGALIAIAGCQRGMECGTSASAVGQATTSAVVTGIVLIISTCAVLTFVFNVLGI